MDARGRNLNLGGCFPRLLVLLRRLRLYSLNICPSSLMAQPQLGLCFFGALQRECLLWVLAPQRYLQNGLFRRTETTQHYAEWKWNLWEPFNVFPIDNPVPTSTKGWVTPKLVAI